MLSKDETAESNSFIKSRLGYSSDNVWAINSFKPIEDTFSDNFLGFCRKSILVNSSGIIISPVLPLTFFVILKSHNFLLAVINQ